MNEFQITSQKLTITALSEEGDGIGRLDGLAVFIPGALPGETVEFEFVEKKKNYARGALVKILEPSDHRVVPPCPYVRECGGCQLQHLDYQAQLEAKRITVKDALERIGGFSDVDVPKTLGMTLPMRYRNNAQYPIRKTNGKLKIGFFKASSHDVVDIKDCLLQPKENAQLIESLRTWIHASGVSVYNPKTQEGLLRHLMIRHGNVTGGMMAVLVVNGKKLPDETDLISELLKYSPKLESIIINTNKKPGNQVLGNHSRVLYGKEKIKGRINGFTFGISPQSFFQVNTLQTEILYAKAIEFAALTGKETVFDVYSGIGTISLSLSKNAAKVYGIESISAAVADANENTKLAGVSHVEFITGLAENVMPALAKEGVHAEVILVDPPRKGCELPVLNAILDLKPERIVYVSCKPSTLARDLKILCQESSGYSLTAVQPVDMFGMTGHVETVVLLHRQ